MSGLIHFVVIQWKEGLGGKKRKGQLGGCEASTKSCQHKVEGEPEKAKMYTQYARFRRPPRRRENQSLHKGNGTEKKNLSIGESSQSRKWKQGELKQTSSAFAMANNVCMGVKEVFVISARKVRLTRRHYLNGQPSLKYSDLQRQSTQTMMQILSAIHRFCEAESGRPRLKSKNENEIGWNRSSSACWKAISNGIQ